MQEMGVNLILFVSVIEIEERLQIWMWIEQTKMYLGLVKIKNYNVKVLEPKHKNFKT
jgi:hypothetical protein